ncbi:MAG: HlyD family secretion protein [Paracoccaceae bacterium]
MNAVSNPKPAIVEVVGESAPQAKPAAVEAPSAPKPAAPTPMPEAAKPKRRRVGLMLALPVVLLAGGAVYWVNGGRYESTDNANLHQARINIASEIGGRVVSVNVVDGKMVTKGTVMFQVDPEPYQLALTQANIAVEAARLQVDGLKGAYNAAVAQAKLATDDAKYQTAELARQVALSGRGVGTGSALDEARNTERQVSEQASLAAIVVANARAALGGDPTIETDKHPTVAAALAARDQAAYQLKLTEVRAPSDGLVYQATSFQPGQFVTAGSSLFTFLAAGDIWVDANFKETQLTTVKPGAAVTVTFDVDTSKKVPGHVEAIGAGTGSEFSLLPAQNATGNWVKVTQRVPVRIRLDNLSDAARVVSGMSASVAVSTGATRSWSDLVPSFLSGK